VLNTNIRWYISMYRPKERFVPKFTTCNLTQT
jgi:hypothetical protein